LADAAVGDEIAADPALKLGEAHMDGRLIIEEGNIFELLSLLRRNGLHRLVTPRLKARETLRGLKIFPGNDGIGEADPSVCARRSHRSWRTRPRCDR
jgi:hypothetical protein